MTRQRLTLAITLATTLAVVNFSSPAYPQTSRDDLLIVGSSTVYPLAMKVAEKFSQSKNFKPPRIQSTGTGAGIEEFCAGIGPTTPDIVNASRPIKPSEIKLCAQNGVKEIIEIKIGNDAVVLARLAKADSLPLTRKEIFMALTKNAPDPQGSARLIPNPYKVWKDINPALPGTKISVWVPDEAHGTHDLVISHIMVAGCKQFAWLQALESTDPQTYKVACETFREDGAYKVFSELDQAIQAVKSDSSALGIVGYILLRQNPDLQASSVDGAEPLSASISHGVYPLTRPLFFYLKKAHVGVIPGLKEFVAEFTSDKAWGSTGYLFDIGLIPMPLKERQQAKTNADELRPLSQQ